MQMRTEMILWYI